MNNLTRFQKMTSREKRGKYKYETVTKTKEEIKFLCNELLIKTALAAFSIGERLVAMKDNLDHGKFLSYLEREFPLTYRTANRYMHLFEYFKNDPSAIESRGIKEALIKAGIIKPKEDMACVEGYNRIDLGGDPGQMKFDFAELFDAPSAINPKLQNYRTVGDLVSEIIVVRRTDDGSLTSKCIIKICEDIPQDVFLKQAYKTMSKKTQMAVEEYLSVLEQKEKE